ncbi:MAG: hypothetical protein K1X55_03370 [Chitinophagales bacterium]|nr:hypothetical protein [Chitinophagales bacterium]
MSKQVLFLLFLLVARTIYAQDFEKNYTPIKLNPLIPEEILQSTAQKKTEINKFISSSKLAKEDKEEFSLSSAFHCKVVRFTIMIL